MIRRMVRQMLTAQVFSALTVSLCLLIDSIMIGRFLGEEAIAAYGLANPLLLAIGAIGTLLAALGHGSQQEANAGYSSALAVAAAISLLFLALVLPLRGVLAQVLGAGGEGTLYAQTRDYLAGFSIGAPGSMGALVLVPFLQMAGQSGLLIAAVLTMTVADVALDLLNVLIFHGGMFGMGLASALSYYAAMLVAGAYFLSKKSVFRFSRRLVQGKRMLALFRSGLPACFNMIASVILVFLMNRILTACGGSNAVAAFAVILSIGNAACCISTGIGGVSLTLVGVFFNEEDRTALKELLRLLSRYSLLLGLVMGAVLLAAAPLLAALFIPEAGSTREMAVLGVRLFAAGLIPCCLTTMLKNAYQVMGRVTLTACACMAENALLPALAAFVCSRFLGPTGAWLYFALGETLALLCLCLYIRRRSGNLPWRNGAALLLPTDFGVGPDDLMEVDIHSMQEVTAASEQAARFCLQHGQGARESNHIALCVEEMAGNVIRHGFTVDGKPHHLSVRILNKPDCWVLRLRDDCRAFDPVRFDSGDGSSFLGIRLVMAMAREAYYTNSLNLNNLVLKLPKQ